MRGSQSRRDFFKLRVYPSPHFVLPLPHGRGWEKPDHDFLPRMILWSITGVRIWSQNTLPLMASIALIVLFTLLSGVGDALGFLHAGRVWQDGRFVWMEAFKSACGFQIGVAMYWLAVHFLSARGVHAVKF